MPRPQNNYKPRKTKNTTPSEQLQNLEKQKIPHHRNNHKI